MSGEQCHRAAKQRLLTPIPMCQAVMFILRICGQPRSRQSLALAEIRPVNMSIVVKRALSGRPEGHADHVSCASSILASRPRGHHRLSPYPLGAAVNAGHPIIRQANTALVLYLDL